jgi:hypothetical protein
MVYSNEYSSTAVSSPSSTFDIDLDEDDDTPPDTFLSTAALQVRQLERERRLQAIDRTFQHVLDETDTQIENASLNFTPNGAAHNEENIRNMEHQIIASQPKSVAGKIKEMAVGVATQQVERLTGTGQQRELEMQSKDAAGNFDDFIPPRNFVKSHDVNISNNNYGGEAEPVSVAGKIKQKATQAVQQVSRFGKKDQSFPFAVQSNTAAGNFDEVQARNNFHGAQERNFAPNDPHRLFNTVVSICRQNSSKIAMAFLAILFIVATTITVDALNDDPTVMILSEETVVNIRLIREVLIKEGFDRNLLHNEQSSQYTAVLQLAEEVSMQELSIESMRENLTPAVTFNDLNQPNGFNVAYAEQRTVIERFVLLVFYFVSTEVRQWERNNNWSAKDKHVNDWQGITCSTLYNDDVALKVVSSIDLSSNVMAGSIPKELCHLRDLEALYLQDNELSGKVPECMGLFKSLKTLEISKNNLSGKVPEGLCDLVEIGMLTEFLSDCGGGGKDDIECRCCTECL